MPKRTKKHSRRRKDRIFTRVRNGEVVYYADFRDIGGGREALKPSGRTRGAATTDPEVAAKLCADRVAELLAIRNRSEREAAGLIKRQAPTLKQFAAHHLNAKAQARKVTYSWLERTEMKLRTAVAFFGDRPIDSITVDELRAYIVWLETRPGRRGNKSVSGGTLRHYLNALSQLMRRAASEGVVPPGFNPVGAMLEKPTAKRDEARWLEVDEAALLLESARTYKPRRLRGDGTIDSRTIPYIHALIATFLLTGGRKSEVLGLQVGDINFERKTVTFRVNNYRRLKTMGSARVVPLWPQLEEILRAHLRDRQIAGGLLFPAPEGNGMVVELRKQLDAVAVRAGWKAGDIRTKMFRHTYTSSRLQTLDGGAPVSPFTVARELGHGGMSLVNRIYGHLGVVRHRSDVVEYRTSIIGRVSDEQRKEELQKRLKALRTA